jgi:hypothetical protein
MVHSYDQSEHNPTDHEDPLAGPTWIVGVGGTVVLIVVVTALTALFYQAQNEDYEAVYVDATEASTQAIAEGQRHLLTATTRKEQRDENGKTIEVDVRTIPIDRAIEETIKRYGSAPGGTANPGPRTRAGDGPTATAAHRN